MSKRTPVRNGLEYLGVQLLRLLFQLFPIDMNLRTAKLLGWLWSRIQRSRLGIARDNLKHAFGSHYSDCEIERLALRSMQSLMMTGVELIQSPRLIRRWTWPKYATLDDSVRALIEIAMRGQPAILVTGHFGNFELLGQLVALFVGRFNVVMRPLDNPRLNDYLIRTRGHTGLNLIAKKGAMEACTEVLRRRELLGLLPDQDAGRKGIFVDFFGRKASTVKSIALLVVEFEVPLIVGHCRRDGDRFQHILAVDRVIEPHEWQDRDEPVRWITQEYVRTIERVARRYPEQYMWTHRRWKSRPPEEAKSGDSGRQTQESRAPHPMHS